MKTLHSNKAGAIGSQKIESLTLVFDQEPPELTDDFELSDWEAWCMAEAEKLADALGSTLSQGVMDRLVSLLMLQRAKLFIAPWGVDEA